MTNPFNYADGLLKELEGATKKADKDAITAELNWVAEEVKRFDVSNLTEDGRHFVSDVVTRLAEVMDAK